MAAVACPAAPTGQMVARSWSEELILLDQIVCLVTLQYSMYVGWSWLSLLPWKMQNLIAQLNDHLISIALFIYRSGVQVTKSVSLHSPAIYRFRYEHNADTPVIVTATSDNPTCMILSIQKPEVSRMLLTTKILAAMYAC